MSRLVAWTLVAGLFTHVYGLMRFINPPPSGRIGDLSNSPTYNAGTIVNVGWTPGEEGGGVSLVLYQQNETDGVWFGDMEYLTQNAVNITNYSWLVGTRKNLTLSNLFYLSVFQEGKGPSDSNSHYFYIEDNRTKESDSSSSSLISSTLISQGVPTGIPTSTLTGSPASSTPTNAATISVPTGSVTNAPSLSTQETPSDAFPLGAKIGLGVGIPVALILGLAAGWLLFQHHKKNGVAPSYPADEIPTTQNVQYKSYGNAGYYGGNMNEVPAKSPVEMAHGFHTWKAEPQSKPTTPAIVRYEM
ncbi:hypothetical protein P3342_005783 [Pyrenophora teres f. teres]|uniref:Mid2 domain-containing protein n=2 Tax=Pyrenophora teres f. teres TaxID=97479 RepID=E3RRS6_PYRTT|nr:hypothetical protein PTT_11543 [Pyrenophora teres f. teres 0-1]KAE8845768.1 hypothetical protein HRS9139_00335 [Pyrenophora teres f. teres]KAE8847907.1 hypothetical protein PTNB85_01750 [Pyrenophora teres f. teres]KAE8853933.1 hypothetical protein HRS9122_00925 [Pyrenophora teres f. teres]KAE8867833.1 hypothetical protein PTNB29_01744 [Pyrenophora teres f. teres]